MGNPNSGGFLPPPAFPSDAYKMPPFPARAAAFVSGSGRFPFFPPPLKPATPRRPSSPTAISIACERVPLPPLPLRPGAPLPSYPNAAGFLRAPPPFCRVVLVRLGPLRFFLASALLTAWSLADYRRALPRPADEAAGTGAKGRLPPSTGPSGTHGGDPNRRPVHVGRRGRRLTPWVPALPSRKKWDFN